jgi:hypothetical protein
MASGEMLGFASSAQPTGRELKNVYPPDTTVIWCAPQRAAGRLAQYTKLFDKENDHGK